jgi:hypothetical protein
MAAARHKLSLIGAAGGIMTSSLLGNPFSGSGLPGDIRLHSAAAGHVNGTSSGGQLDILQKCKTFSFESSYSPLNLLFFCQRNLQSEAKRFKSAAASNLAASSCRSCCRRRTFFRTQSGTLCSRQIPNACCLRTRVVTETFFPFHFAPIFPLFLSFPAAAAS